MLKRSSWVALAVALVLAGCGSSDDDGGGGSADEPTSELAGLKDGELPKEYPFDTSGDDPDLLEPEKLSFRSYQGVPLSWQFPVGYKQTDDTEAELEVDGVIYELDVGAVRMEGTPRSYLESLTGRVTATGSAADLVPVEKVYTTELGDEDRAVLLSEDKDKYGSSIDFASQGADGIVTVVRINARTSRAGRSEAGLATFSSERIAELHQVVRSLQVTR